MKDRMHYLIYVSAATELMSDAELAQILEVSRRRNVEDGITGMLLYKDGSFMQLLEGPRDKVTATFERIGRDPRHHGLIILREADADARCFPDWSMGFRSIKAAELAAVPGYIALGNETFASPAFTENPHIALKVLLSFYKTMT